MTSLDCPSCNISDLLCDFNNKTFNTIVNTIIIVLSACGLILLIAGALCTYTTVKLSSGVNCESVYVAGLLISAAIVMMFLFSLIACLASYGFDNVQNGPKPLQSGQEKSGQGKLNQGKVTKYKNSPLRVVVV